MYSSYFQPRRTASSRAFLLELLVGLDPGLDESELLVRLLVGGELLEQIASVVIPVPGNQVIEVVTRAGALLHEFGLDLRRFVVALQPSGRTEIHSAVGLEIVLVGFLAAHEERDAVVRAGDHHRAGRGR